MLFTVGGDGSLGCWSRKTSHYSSFRCNDYDENPKEEGIEVSSGEESRGRRYLDTSHYSSSNLGG